MDTSKNLFKSKLDVEMKKFHYSHVDKKDVRTAIEKIVEIHKNIVTNPEVPKYRKIRLSNQGFQDTIWSLVPAQNVMKMAGWHKDKEFLCLPQNADVKTILNVILDNRTVLPQNNWTGAVHEGPSYEQKLESQLKTLALAEKDEELAKCLQEKEERKKLAELIKAEHQADRQRVNTLNPYVKNKPDVN